MASPAGNPNPNPSNPNPPFEMAMLFHPPPPNPAAAPMYPGPPPPSGPYSYPPAVPTFHHAPFPHHFMGQDPQNPMLRPVVSYAMPNANPNLGAIPIANPGANSGARLMQLLGNAGSGHLESAVSLPLPSSEFAAATQPLQLPAMPSAPPARMLSTTSSKVPRGRLLGGGDKAVHNVDSRLPGEAQPPQLEVTPITKYTSDPGLVLGRQIAVNRTYIVYGLKMGNIRVLNINTALRSLLRGHTQRVTDMAFFADDVHRLASVSVDGRIYVWRIDEGTDEENKPQISGKIEVAIQIVGDAEAYHPRICWHSHKQELLFVGIRNCVLRIDTTKVGKGRDFNMEEPMKCHLDELIDGVRLVGKHDGDVTDLSISQWMTTRLASGSKDGTVKIWDDRKPVPLSILKPHDGQAVYSVAFLTAPARPHHINLITAGPLNREIKIWASTNEDGWLFPSESETWNCKQTLELVSSLEPKVEEAFFNQVAVLPQASIIILANAKKNAIHTVHVEYGPDPASTRLDCIADFTVAMPILSLTGTHESQPDGEQVVQVYCVQTMAIQQHGLELSLCSPPTSDTGGLGRDPAISRVHDTPLEVLGADSSTGTSFTDSYTVGASSKQSTFDKTTEFDHKPSAAPLTYTEGDGSAHLPSAPLASNTDITGLGPSNRDKDQSAFNYPTNRSTEPVALTRQDTPMPKSLALTRQDTPMPKDSFGKDELRDSHNDVKMLPNPRMMFKDHAKSKRASTGKTKIGKSTKTTAPADIFNTAKEEARELLLKEEISVRQEGCAMSRLARCTAPPLCKGERSISDSNAKACLAQESVSQCQFSFVNCSDSGSTAGNKGPETISQGTVDEIVQIFVKVLDNPTLSVQLKSNSAVRDMVAIAMVKHGIFLSDVFIENDGRIVKPEAEVLIDVMNSTFIIVPRLRGGVAVTDPDLNSKGNMTLDVSFMPLREYIDTAGSLLFDIVKFDGIAPRLSGKYFVSLGEVGRKVYRMLFDMIELLHGRNYSMRRFNIDHLRYIPSYHIIVRIPGMELQGFNTENFCYNIYDVVSVLEKCRYDPLKVAANKPDVRATGQAIGQLPPFLRILAQQARDLINPSIKKDPLVGKTKEWRSVYRLDFAGKSSSARRALYSGVDLFQDYLPSAQKGIVRSLIDNGGTKSAANWLYMAASIPSMLSVLNYVAYGPGNKIIKKTYTIDTHSLWECGHNHLKHAQALLISEVVAEALFSSLFFEEIAHVPRVLIQNYINVNPTNVGQEKNRSKIRNVIDMD